MNHYQRCLILEARPAAVYAALTTPAGLRGWWTQDCHVDTEVGGKLHLRFGSTEKHLRIERLVPMREVRWRCTGAHIAAGQLRRRDEWVGTELVFRLTPDGLHRTRLDFEHIGLDPSLECYRMCNDAWNHFLDSLQQFVETGRGMPHEPATAEV